MIAGDDPRAKFREQERIIKEQIRALHRRKQSLLMQFRIAVKRELAGSGEGEPSEAS